jgi:hypothetical protein
MRGIGADGDPSEVRNSELCWERHRSEPKEKQEKAGVRGGEEDDVLKEHTIKQARNQATPRNEP